MRKELMEKIEESRYRLYTISPEQKEKLLDESKKLDLLILAYHRSTPAGLKHHEEM